MSPPRSLEVAEGSVEAPLPVAPTGATGDVTRTATLLVVPVLPHRRALVRALVATAVTLMSLLSYPLVLWWANHAASPWMWSLGIYASLAVLFLVCVVAPIALVCAIVWYLVAWRRFVVDKRS